VQLKKHGYAPHQPDGTRSLTAIFVQSFKCISHNVDIYHNFSIFIVENPHSLNSVQPQDAFNLSEKLRGVNISVGTTDQKLSWGVIISVFKYIWNVHDYVHGLQFDCPELRNISYYPWG
jgi:hypothetical protein